MSESTIDTRWTHPMRRAYRLLVGVSGVTWIGTAIFDVNDVGFWRAVMVSVGLLMLWEAWRDHSRKLRLTVAYLAGVTAAVEIGEAVRFTIQGSHGSSMQRAFLWMAVGIYTVGLVAFGWVPETSEQED